MNPQCTVSARRAAFWHQLQLPSVPACVIGLDPSVFGHIRQSWPHLLITQRPGFETLLDSLKFTPTMYLTGWRSQGPGSRRSEERNWQQGRRQCAGSERRHQGRHRQREKGMRLFYSCCTEALLSMQVQNHSRQLLRVLLPNCCSHKLPADRQEPRLHCVSTMEITFHC